jgi:four helix bundle protein
MSSNQSSTSNPILELSFQFALDSIASVEVLEENKKFVIANQYLKCSTSIGANVREAQGAESKQDFIHKMRIAYKEAEEAEYWLLLCKFAQNYPTNEDLLASIVSIKKLLNKIISTSHRNTLLSLGWISALSKLFLG